MRGEAPAPLTMRMRRERWIKSIAGWREEEASSASAFRGRERSRYWMAASAARTHRVSSVSSPRGRRCKPSASITSDALRLAFFCASTQEDICA